MSCAGAFGLQRSGADGPPLSPAAPPTLNGSLGVPQVTGKCLGRLQRTENPHELPLMGQWTGYPEMEQVYLRPSGIVRQIKPGGLYTRGVVCAE
jgi:hypothetical protein